MNFPLAVLLAVAGLSAAVPKHARAALPTTAEFANMCRLAEKLADNERVSNDQHALGSMCAAFLSGWIESMHVMEVQFDLKNPSVCLPKGVSGEQVVRVFNAWIREHPEQLHLDMRTVLLRALVHAFPCRQGRDGSKTNGAAPAKQL